MAAAREHFELPDDTARLDIVIGDGCEYMRTGDSTFDQILGDGFNEHAHPGELNTLPFYRACRSRLSEQGLLAANLIGLSAGYKGGFAHIEAAFDGRAVLFPKCRSGNTIAFAATGEAIDIPLEELKERARALEVRTACAAAVRFQAGRGAGLPGREVEDLVGMRARHHLLFRSSFWKYLVPWIVACSARPVSVSW